MTIGSFHISIGVIVVVILMFLGLTAPVLFVLLIRADRAYRKIRSDFSEYRRTHSRFRLPEK